MENTNYIKTHKAIFKNSFKLFFVGCLTLTSCLVSSATLAVNPEQDLSSKSIMTDCSGTSSDSSQATFCQKESEDLSIQMDFPAGEKIEPDLKILPVSAD